MSLRVVYDNQMLVPREEMVPALIINPHNPPPWLQNSPVQPQIIYIQQQQQNYVQQVQQLDQNQVYIQQYGYQNPQMFIPNYEQIRPIQIVPNVMQVPANAEYSNERMVQTMPQTFAPTQTNVQNQMPIQNIQNPVNTMTMPIQSQQLPERIENPHTQVRFADVRVPNVIQMRPAEPVRQMQPNQIQVPRPETQFRPNARMIRPQIPTTAVHRRPVLNSNIVRTPRFAYRPIQPRLRTQIPVQKRFVQSTSMPNVINVTNMGPTPVNTMETVNRKRKSESPDEIQKKLNILAINNSPILLGQLANPTIQNEIKTEKPPIPVAITNNSVSTQVKKIDLDTSQTNSTHGLVNQINLAQSLLDKEKLVRNTVFTQARGRILNVKNETKPENVTIDVQTDEIMKQTTEETKTVETNVKENKDINKVEIDENIRNVNKGINNRSETTEDMKLTDKDYILTHVLDGFVIQESNVAFPIRKPLVEKTIRLSSETKELIPNAEDIADKDLEDHIPSVAIVVDRSKKLDEKENDVDSGNPFRNLTPATIKTWTVEQLTKHLDDRGWPDTSAAFFEHEIDGESLLLVSKSQLLTIGVKEHQADIIMEFMSR
ncbi:uncharacterized protein LOC119836541 [Zerene cesonia]|uniref:uncharacterized protein LOC119836541 n=1 Tax=Zerene cesonia TaxID=33412 RepID=UPI0018E554EB|nr:uncharacterized protein LOC119836541 [Zerene cesonia]